MWFRFPGCPLGSAPGDLAARPIRRGGRGAGVSVEPVAYLVIQQDRAQLLHMNSPSSPMGKLLDIMPDVIEELKKYTRKDGDQ